MTTIVSVTPNPVARDTRAYKVAASLSRFGYESVLVEGAPSPLDHDALPFALHTFPPEARLPGLAAESGGGSGNDAPDDSSAPTPAPEAEGPPRGVVGRLSTWGARVLPARVTGWLRPRLAPFLDWVNAKTEPLSVLLSMLRMNRKAMRSLPPAEAYYLHSFWNFPAAYLKSKRHRARLIYDAHDAHWVPDPAVDAVVGRSTLRLLERIDRLCARRSNAFLTVGNGLAGLLDEHLERRPIVIRNGHDLRIDEPAPNDIRSALGLSDDDFLLVMTGAAKPGDTVEVALEVLNRLPDHVHLALVGKDHEPRRALIAEHGLTDRVHLHEPVPPTQVASFIRTADASPILYHALSDAYVHSLPNRFFHAVAAGLPILYPPLHEIKALCDQYEMGIEIDPTDADSTEAGIRALLDDPKLVSEYSANVERARPELSWEHEEPILSDVLKRTLMSKGRVN